MCLTHRKPDVRFSAHTILRCIREVLLVFALPPMMAFDRMPSPRLEVDTVDALRAVMQRAVNRGDHGQELQDVLMRAATEAREKDIHAEQLLIFMKDLWYSLPDVRKAEDSDRQTELLQELISRCITQYYAS